MSFLSDITSLFEGGTDFIGGVTDTIGEGISGLTGLGGDLVDGVTSLGKGIFSVLETGSDIWGSISNIAGDVLFTGLETYTAFKASDAAKKWGKSQAEVYYSNADMYSDEAMYIRQKTLEQADRTRLEGLRFLGQQTVSYLKSGVTLEGSPLLVLRETNDLLQLKIDDIVGAGERSAKNKEKQAEIEKKKAQAALDEAAFKAESVLLQSAAKTAQSLFF